MKLHTDTLTISDMHRALTATVPAATLEAVEQGSRSRARGVTFRIAADARPGRRRRDDGRYGAEDAFMPAYTYAATWDEHGAFFARLFTLDPEAIIGPYKGRADFNRQTAYKYAAPECSAISREEGR